MKARAAFLLTKKNPSSQHDARKYTEAIFSSTALTQRRDNLDGAKYSLVQQGARSVRPDLQQRTQSDSTVARHQARGVHRGVEARTSGTELPIFGLLDTDRQHDPFTEHLERQVQAQQMAAGLRYAVLFLDAPSDTINRLWSGTRVLQWPRPDSVHWPQVLRCGLGELKIDYHVPSNTRISTSTGDTMPCYSASRARRTRRPLTTLTVTCQSIST